MHAQRVTTAWLDPPILHSARACHHWHCGLRWRHPASWQAWGCSYLICNSHRFQGFHPWKPLLGNWDTPETQPETLAHIIGHEWCEGPSPGFMCPCAGPGPHGLHVVRHAPRSSGKLRGQIRQRSHRYNPLDGLSNTVRGSLSRQSAQPSTPGGQHGLLGYLL